MITTNVIALVGCGAISEEFYLPVLAKRSELLKRLWLVDPAPDRLHDMADRFGIPRERTTTRVDGLPPGVTIAFNATPSHLHLTTSKELLGRGINVFLEKPLGETGAEGAEIVAAGAGRLKVGVNQYRRLIPTFETVRQRIASGELGRITRISWNEGNKFGWPAQSPFYFRRPWADGQPRGTLLDAGSHIVDLFCWWLGGELEVTEAVSDGYGGPEEFVHARMRRGGIEVDLKLGMHARMANRFSVEGERGSLGGPVYDFRRFFFTSPGGTPRQVIVPGFTDRAGIADRLVSNFVAAAAGAEPLLIDATTVLPSLRTIDAVYKAMQAPLPGYYAEWRA